MAAANVHAFSGKPIKLDAVYVRTTTRAIGGPPSDHPRHTFVVTWLSDGEGDQSMLACEADESAPRPVFNPGDKVTVEGVGAFLVLDQDRYELRLASCHIALR